ncbi:branched-chain amino acid ABC transporter permease [Halomarina litorea]|uniref:branched-chain amino acid ABC transporter permease n=1 Tax=Halomarina litorea TaxID=2961595 RepID=UPI0020C5221E|nr:branched-chain amino acid ABC transporter permease [Halomarina sp. BCD28]
MTLPVVPLQVAGDLVRLVINGITTGSIYILLAVGLSIILGTLKFVNFAHGALYIVGAYLGLIIAQQPRFGGKLPEWLQDLGLIDGATVGLGWGYLAALVVVPVVVFVVGLLMERFVAQPFYDRPDTDQILLTFGLALILQELFRVLFGGQSQSIAQPPWAEGSALGLPLVGDVLRFFGVSGVSTWRLVIILITAVLVGIVYLLIEYTDFGLTVRAGTVDAEMVELLGIRLSRPYLVVFGIGAALAGVAGLVGGPLVNFNPDYGGNILVPAFLTVVVGGVGSIRGAVLGGLLFGLVQAGLIQFGFAAWSEVGIYAMAAIVLLVRPEGLLGDEVVA